MFIGTGPIPLTRRPIHETVASIVEEIRAEVHEFVGNLPSQPRVCFVLDGEPLPAKRSTHKLRARRSYQHLKAARRLVNIHVAKQPQAQATATTDKFLARFAARASGWIRWFGPLKQNIVAELVRRGCVMGFDPKGLSQFSVVVAPFEADPKCVEIANQCSDAVIWSSDGDLQIYPFADNALVG